MRLAVVIQRYGSEIVGGSEHLCRLVAERLAPQHDVEVLTTCARDKATWRNDYQEGADRIRGVTVRRFANARTRDQAAFKRLCDRIYDQPHSHADEMEWLRLQGPWSPGLIEYLKRHHRQYDVIIFFTYRHATTVLGLEVAPAKSVLVAAARDEPAIQLDIFKEVFARPAALCHLTDSERAFVHQQFHDLPALEEVTGIGVDLPQHQPYPRVAPLPADEEGEDDQPAPGFSSPLNLRGSAFRRRHRLHGPIALYGGRIEPGKGSEELIEYFNAYVEGGGNATMTMMGVKMMPVGEEPFLRFAGVLSDRERLQALEAATVVLCPSPTDRLALLALEALSVGTPILANARSAALVEHCVRSHGGLYYADRDEFVECLKLLVGQERLRAAMGQNGRDYVRRNCRWDVVLGKYDRILAKVRNGASPSPPRKNADVGIKQGRQAVHH